MSSLKGYRTYLCVAAAVVVSGLNAMGFVSDEMRNMLLGVCGFGGMAAIRSAISKP